MAATSITMTSQSSRSISTISAGGLSAPAIAFLLPELRGDDSPRTVLLCANEDIAEQIHSDLEFFAQFRAARWKNFRLERLRGWEHSPYRNLQPGLAARLDRLSACHRVQGNEGGWTLVAGTASFLQAAAARDFFRESFQLRKGKALPPEEITKKLIRFGYTPAESVEDPGTFSLRGAILDVFAPSHDHPLRIEFFDEDIESIRMFNPETQRSVRILSDGENVELIPAREFACDADTLARAREHLKTWADSNDIPRAARDRVSSLFSQGIVTPEMEFMIPFFREHAAWITDLLPEGTTLVLHERGPLEEEYGEWRAREEDLYAKSLARQQMFPEPARLYQELGSAISHPSFRKVVEARELAFLDEQPRFERIKLASRARHADVDGLVKHIKALTDRGSHTVIVANSQSQIDRVAFLLNQHRLRSVAVKSDADLPKDPSIVSLALGTVSESFHLPEKKIAFVSEDDVFGEKQHSARTKKAIATAQPLTTMDDLAIGDLVVHNEHGIGRYTGLSRMKALGTEGDFVQVEFAGGDKLYLPVYRLESLGRYIGAAGSSSAHLDKLGSGGFEKTKSRVKAAIKDIARDLLRVQAERASRPGYSFSPPDEEFRGFEAEFPYDETPDQAKAIDDTIADMHRASPMDRLVCGDVGFGKTEVAIRAAFKAAQDGKQVAVLVPTTILAEQHYLNFSERMKGYPVKLASLSRFKAKKEQEATLKELEEGKLDILIGTHRLLSKDVRFKDLGLLIVDEEQRFGVEHKEKLKQLKASTDVLTLTATPIPRTLQMSLMGLKDISIIRTPPGDRLSIKTYLANYDENVIENAIRHELGRGGQVFIIHNRVQTIGKIAEAVERLVPEAKVTVAHGQMPETQLERAMIGFYQKKFDVLIATAIIENGLDVPNANTLIVNRADTFGLSQLYQIRGRVGRSQTRAFAYFLVPETSVITEDARERLAVLQRFVELGSGYHIATHDLELRGGGDVLGSSQSGHIGSVGYEMYLELLQEEIHRLKGEEVAKPLEEVEINLPFPAMLPETYVPDMKDRLALYRRLSSLRLEEQVDDARKELEDRYGSIPTEAHELLKVIQLKVLMRRMGLKSLTVGPKGASLSPGKDPLLEPGTILYLVQSKPDHYAILPEGKFVMKGDFGSSGELYDRLRVLLSSATQ
jgi:transcription-repair coupling factor (superfamily II helicase)